MLPIEFISHNITFVPYVFVEIFRLFWLTPRTPQWRKNEKICKKSIFLRFKEVFVNFSIYIVDWNVKKGQQGKSLLPSSLFRKVYCSFLNENGLKLVPKMTELPKFSYFQSFYAFFPKFRQSSWMGMSKRVNKESMYSPVCLVKR